ncbi:MAG: pantetheine-phosphate adenylyltransferase [Actinomycetota bacterium]
MNVAICPGTFDPVTNGHLDVISRVAKHFGRVVVAVAENAGKDPLFTIEERLSMLNECLADHENIEVVAFDCLLVDLAHQYGSCAIVKGLRAMSDFEFEFQMAQFNRQMDEAIETFFVMASPEYTYLSSSGVKEVAAYGGSIRGLVPPTVEARFNAKYRGGQAAGASGKE